MQKPGILGILEYSELFLIASWQTPAIFTKIYEYSEF